MKFILILTLAINVQTGFSGSGIGGVAMAEFDDKKACEVAARNWLSQFSVLKPNSNEREFKVSGRSGREHGFKRALCLPKSTPKE
jgi:hypothetical protein